MIDANDVKIDASHVRQLPLSGVCRVRWMSLYTVCSLYCVSHCGGLSLCLVAEVLSRCTAAAGQLTTYMWDAASDLCVLSTPFVNTSPCKWAQLL